MFSYIITNIIVIYRFDNIVTNVYYMKLDFDKLIDNDLFVTSME